MEFSFDRSRESQSRNTSGPQGQPQNQSQNQRPEVQAAPAPESSSNTIDTSAIANERLRKAIERNRAKQAGRETQNSVQQPRQPQQESLFSESSRSSQAEQFRDGQVAEQQMNMEREKEVPRHEVEDGPVESPRAKLRARIGGVSAGHQNSAVPPNNTGLVSRRSVARPDEAEFVPVKRTPKKVASQISYTTASTRKKQQAVDSKYLNWLVKGSWIFCALMVLRLIFAAGGVTDFYSQKASVVERVNELNFIKKENMTLVREIERMRTDVGFQKKLVRDNLGFIASDEFLVLFPK